MKVIVVAISGLNIVELTCSNIEFSGATYKLTHTGGVAEYDSTNYKIYVL